jgi:hypothetical protein
VNVRLKMASDDDEEKLKLKLNTFHVRINEGAEQQVSVKTGNYYLAAAAALALLGYSDDDGETVVKIWVPSLLPDYGPYYYKYDGHTLYNVQRLS